MAAVQNAAAAYFPEHIARLQYDELTEMYSPEDEHGLKLLSIALMRRALVDVQRLIMIRDEKPSLQNLVKTGVLGENMLSLILKAEKELEAEMVEVVEEAEVYRTGWGKSIFQEASNLLQQQAQAQAMAAAKAAANKEV
ncbi:Sec62/63 complex, subunit Sec66 [Zopfochytrium polystomum]|nr:Sec62/63 complex, subunit Sec66 [Zopfochytrium polystomum]